MFLKDHVPVTFGEMAVDEKTWSLSFDLPRHEKDGENLNDDKHFGEISFVEEQEETKQYLVRLTKTIHHLPFLVRELLSHKS